MVNHENGPRTTGHQDYHAMRRTHMTHTDDSLAAFIDVRPRVGTTS